ncbi:MAG: alkyl hydroperoxide reductase subunit F [Rubrivivax sp.]|nr:alkyl hydroperoxide reductase subunit F [Rubrivivax sp.]
MLDATLRTQLQAHLQRLIQPIELVASLDDRPASAELRELLEEIATLSDLIRLRLDGQDERRPSFSINRTGADIGLRFAAIPMGHEFTSLVLALLQAGGHPPRIDDETVAQIRTLDGDFVFETYMSLSCHNCPDVVQALNLMAVLNPRVRHVTIDGALFQNEVDARQIMAVPAVYLNGQPFGSGRMELAEILAKVDRGAVARDAARLASRPTFDVLIVGGGPAGAAAAVYAARKGIRTGVVAECFGGQTLDTLGIENYLSVLETQGPTFAAAMEAHARAYGVDIMNGQRVSDIEPAAGPGEPITVTLENGAQLHSRTVILSTGARWRQVGVPGEAEYANKGVAYCPHCDGPLFKGKKVAVIGGGNSGIEAAIDLAGLVDHVTVVEFADRLKADAVLIDKLATLPNVVVHTNAQTTEITGDGQKVDGLVFKDRASGELHRVDLSGVFVQIGLVPNTEFLRGRVELSRHGEVIVDDRGATSLPGVFAAGDATTVPFKQIIIAAGDGAKAALGAFDHLMRTPAARPSEARSAVPAA